MTTQSPTVGAASPVPDLLDVRAVSRMTTISTRHLLRMSAAGTMPRPVRIGRLLRWRRTTGDPMTGIIEWIAAGCPPLPASEIERARRRLIEVADSKGRPIPDSIRTTGSTDEVAQ